MQKLFLQLVPGKVVYYLAYVFWVFAYRVDHVGNDERELDFEGRLRWTVAWYWFERTRHIRPIYEESLLGDAGLRRRIQVDRSLQQFPAASLEAEGGYGVFWHEDYKV